MKVLRFAGGEVRPEWIDYNGHMNVAYFAVAFDRALDVLLDELDLGRDYATRTGLSVFVVQSRYHYISEIGLGQPYHFDATVLDSDRKRLHAAMALFHSESGELVAACEQLMLSVEMQGRRSCEWPQSATARLRSFAEVPGTFNIPREMLRALRIRRSLEEFAHGTPRIDS
jgi:acyl-CoA thioester hydrolase